jgi:hypothetical protein
LFGYGLRGFEVPIQHGIIKLFQIGHKNFSVSESHTARNV